MKQVIANNFELISWVTAIIFLAINPPDTYYPICPSQWLLIHYCPGCGIGRSIGCALRFDFHASWQYHKLGIPATIILLWRIKSLSTNIFNSNKLKST
ncbi:MAG: DUF2752 domain-containing protein [Bacteroidetes bacterium]|nr:DUF2752 domain-containing protein [Bacteroidota bacterium]